MRIGKLRHRIVIQQNSADPENPDAHGEIVPNWEDVTTVWGSIVQVAGRENYAAQQWDAKTTSLITVRSAEMPTLNPRMRLKWTDYKPFPVVDHYYNVLYVDDHENRGIYKVLQCEEQRL